MGQAVQRVGGAMGAHARLVAPVLLRCCTTERPPALRAGALVTLAEVVAAAGLGFHPWAAELAELCAAALTVDSDVEVRRAAAHALGVMTNALGAELLEITGVPAMKRAYRALTHARECTADELVARHAACALGELEAVCMGFLFPRSAR
mmetsp:Transcript_8319/g.20062  ORF Transcript_8319/g.20062 Transcript_8319/m.20062 type:complete len:150 (+) Transcript_8319:1160-1609(+)